MESEKRIFYRKLWGLVFPIAIQNLMTALVSASDAFMLGFVSQTSLSAVSLATQIPVSYTHLTLPTKLEV